APGSAESTACAPIEVDLSGQAVLIERGAHTSTPDCDATFYAKSLAAQNAGAEAVVLYNSVPGLFSATVAGAEEITIPVVAVDREAALALDATVADDGATPTWTDEIIDAATPTAGLLSSSRSHRLTPALDLKPDLGPLDVLPARRGRRRAPPRGTPRRGHRGGSRRVAELRRPGRLVAHPGRGLPRAGPPAGRRDARHRRRHPGDDDGDARQARPRR